MNNLYKILILIIGFWVSQTPLLAAETAVGGKVPVNILSAIELALAKRLDVKMQELEIEKRQAYVRELNSYMYPTLGFVSRFSDVEKFDSYTGVDVVANFQGTDIPVSISPVVPKNTVEMALKLSWNLFSGGFDVANAQEAQARHEESIADQAIKARQVIIEVSDAFFELNKEIVSNNINVIGAKLAKERLDYSSKLYSSGYDSKIKLIEMEIDYKEKLIEQAKSGKAVENAYRNYLVTMGWSANTIEPLKFSSVSGMSLEYDLDDVVSRFRVMLNPEIRKLKAVLAGTQMRKRAVEAEYYPKLDFSVEHSNVGRGDGMDDAVSDLQKQQNVAMLTVTWDLFKGFETSERLAKLRAEIAQKQLELKFKKESLEKEIGNMQHEVVMLESQLGLAKQQYELKKSREKLALAKFKAQELSKLEYEDIKFEVQKAKADMEKLGLELKAANFSAYIRAL